MTYSTVFNIQHFSLHDGPGIRTTCFLKGCNLRCKWCHNPESFSKKYDLAYDADKCIGCGKCAEICFTGAHRFQEGKHHFFREKCQICGKCAELCPTRALECKGYEISDDALVEELLRDEALYRFSGGGVTFSGGEPLLQKDTILRVAPYLRQKGIHIAIDTAAVQPWKNIEACLPLVDLLLFDIKFFSPEKHKHYTGVDNKSVLENIKKASAYKDMFIRIPVIDGVNDDDKEVAAIADYVAGLGDHVKKTELLSYHDLGISKYRVLGLLFEKFAPVEMEKMNKLKAIFAQRGIDVEIS